MRAVGVAGEPSATTGVRRFGATLGELVGAVREGQGIAPDSMALARLGWLDLGAGTLVLEPTALRMNGALALDPSEADVRWVLLAYMAGLRSVRPESGFSAEDLGLLVAELATLEPSARSVARFRDWIWADGAQGFNCVVAASFLDALDGFVGELPLSDPPPLGNASQERLRPASIATPEQLEAAVRFLDHGPRDESTSPEGCGTLTPLDIALPESLRTRMHQECEDPASWHLAVARASLGTQREGVVSLRGSSRSLAEVSGAALDLAQLEALAQRAAAGNDDASRELTAVDTARFVDQVDLPTLDHHGARALLQVLQHASANDEVWVCVIKGLTPSVALPLLGSLAQGCYRSHAVTLADFAVGLDPQELSPHIVWMAERLGPHAVRFFGALLRASRGGGWTAAALRAVATLLVDAGAGRSVLVPLVCSREVDAQVRLSLLRDLEADREALIEAVQKRVGEDRDPEEVCIRFEALRTSLGLGG